MSNNKQDRDEIFPNNPLEEVTFEMRFPLNLWVRRNIADFYDQIKEEYPSGEREEIFSQETGIELKHTFNNSEQDKSIIVTENEFIFGIKHYQSFETFRQELIKYINLFCTLFKLERIDQIKLNYINNISIQLEEGIATLIKYVNPYVDIQLLKSSNTQSFVIQIVKEINDYILLSSNALIPKENSQESVYILDFDAKLTKAIIVQDVFNHLTNLHDIIQEEFLMSVTENYKIIMRTA